MAHGLKKIHPSGIDAALAKADKYRELNQPAEAVSICRDVLAIEPDHQLAGRILGLALTDQLGAPGGGRYFAEARAVFAGLRDPYERAFYGGLACERQAKVQLATDMPFRSVRPLFDEAFARYAEAERLRPPGNDDALLRWNSCVRVLATVPEAEEHEADTTELEGDFAPPRR